MSSLPRNLQALNLNLLKTLYAVLRYRSVTRAAEELHLTQAAVSNNLRRLRQHFDDRLVIRDGRSLRLTPRAAALLDPLGETLTALSRVIETDVFAPEKSSRSFRIVAASNISAILMPPLAKLLADEAPHISVQFIGGSALTPHDLRTDRIDVLIGPPQVLASLGLSLDDPAQECGGEHLYTERFVCLVNDRHPVLKQGLTRETYLTMPHASFFLNLDTPGSVEHGYMEAQRLNQFDRLLSSDITVLPLVAAASDLIVLVPQSVADLATKRSDLVILPCPIDIPELEIWSFWNRHREEDTDIVWLRGIIKRGFADQIQQR